MGTIRARRYAAQFACAGLFAFANLGLATSALAQDKTAKIGVLNDMSSLYADIGGPNSVVAIKMAVEDSGLTKKGWKIDVVSGDHQNKPDVGVNIARQWIDNDKVDAIADTPNSGVALAVSNIVKEKNAVLLNSGAASADLTGKPWDPKRPGIQWDGAKWTAVTPNWVVGDKAMTRRLLEESSAKYAAEKHITPACMK